MTTPPPRRRRPELLQAVLAAVGAALLVVGGHWWMIERASSPWPLHDQWLAEGEMLYVPLVEGRLSPTVLFHPHAEHRIVPTRLLALTLFDLNDRQWDVRLQMTVNAILAAMVAALVVGIAARQLRGVGIVLFAGIFGGWLASPLFYGNALWGFQSQFYFLLLFSIGHLQLVLSYPVRSLPWMAGLICSLLAWISMGSGFFSALIVVGIAGRTLLTSSEPTDRRSSLTNLLVHVVMVGSAVALAPARSVGPFDLNASVHTFLHCLSWPHRFYHPWGVWIWFPFLLFTGAALRRRALFKDENLVLALGLWVLAQIAAIAIARGTPAIVITPRYYEIFWLGIAINALALERVWQRLAARRGRAWAQALAAIIVTLWTIGTGYYAVRFAESHRRGDLPAMQSFATSQTTQMQAYVAGNDDGALRAVPYPQIPHPDASYLAQQLAHPTIRTALRVQLADQPAATLSRWANAARPMAGMIAIAGGTLLLMAVAFGALRGSKTGSGAT